MANHATAEILDGAPFGRRGAAVASACALSAITAFVMISPYIFENKTRLDWTLFAGTADAFLFFGFAFGFAPFMLLRFKVFACAGFWGYMRYCAYSTDISAADSLFAVFDWLVVLQICLGVISFVPPRWVCFAAAFLGLIMLFNPVVYALFSNF